MFFFLFSHLPPPLSLLSHFLFAAMATNLRIRSEERPLPPSQPLRCLLTHLVMLLKPLMVPLFSAFRSLYPCSFGSSWRTSPCYLPCLWHVDACLRCLHLAPRRYHVSVICLRRCFSLPYTFLCSSWNELLVSSSSSFGWGHLLPCYFLVSALWRYSTCGSLQPCEF